jgi:hypothetical protein
MIGPGSVDGVEVEQWEEKLLTCLCGCIAARPQALELPESVLGNTTAGASSRRDPLFLFFFSR